MADGTVPRTRDTTGTLDPFDTRTNSGGEHRQVVVLGNDGDLVAGVTSGAVHVHTNAVVRATYIVARGPASGSAPVAPTAPAAVANTDKILLTGWHPATSTKTVKIKRIFISALLGTAVTYLYSVYRVVSAPTGHTVVLPRPTDPSEPASDTQWGYQNTTAIATALVDGSIVDVAQIGTVGGHNVVMLYEWIRGGELEPITLRPGVLEGIAICSRTTTATAPDAIICVEYTEE